MQGWVPLRCLPLQWHSNVLFFVMSHKFPPPIVDNISKYFYWSDMERPCQIVETRIGLLFVSSPKPIQSFFLIAYCKSNHAEVWAQDIYWWHTALLLPVFLFAIYWSSNVHIIPEVPLLTKMCIGHMQPIFCYSSWWCTSPFVVSSLWNMGCWSSY